MNIDQQTGERLSNSAVAQNRYGEYAEDVLQALLDWSEEMPVALVLLTSVVGGGVRAPGAMMAVGLEGQVSGYLSGGCVDADIIFQAIASLKDGKSLTLRYGAGSPYVDISLPCGGAMEVTVMPRPDREALCKLHTLLTTRHRCYLRLDGDGVSVGETPAPVTPDIETTYLYAPKPRLRLAGKGADCLALARLAELSGIETELFLKDEEDIQLARNDGHHRIVALVTPSNLPSIEDDRWTAFALMFHDHEWEAPLLEQALRGDAFFVGAVGSRKTHERRCDDLRAMGVSESEIDRICAPIGVIPAMRQASMLAISALGEIVDAYHQHTSADLSRTAVILLAAGQGKRFGGGDKLLVPINGKGVLIHAADKVDKRVRHRIAVIGNNQEKRREMLDALHWECVVNLDADTGQASSLRTGLDAAFKDDGVQSVLILLGDMPCLERQQIDALNEKLERGASAVMCKVVSGEDAHHLTPPAVFRRSSLDDLSHLKGDRGAKRLFLSLADTQTQSLGPQAARDIDKREDLEAVISC